MEKENIVLETNKLSKKFGDKWAVSNITLEVKSGQIYGILGPNGAGKSTFLRMLMTLLKPTKGDFRLFGTKPSLLNKKMFSRIGGLIEEPRFYTFLNGKQNLYHLGYLSGNNNKEKIDEILKQVGLENAAKTSISEYSHGMKKRLALAQALVHEPDLLILDEPMSGLDPEGAIQIQNILQDLNHEYDVTLLFSSHNLNRVQSICDHMAIMHYGKVVEKGPVDKLLADTDFHTTEVTLDRAQEALELLLTKKWANNVSKKDDNKIKLCISEEQRPFLVEFLVNKGFKVYSVTTQSALEDHYFSIINKQQK